MEKLFIPYETGIPKLAKEKGFDIPCFGLYVPLLDGTTEFEIGISNANKKSKKLISAPTYDQIVNWFIEKHNIHPCYGSNHSGWYWNITKTNGTTIKEQSDNNYFKTHYEALNKAIDESFRLI